MTEESRVAVRRMSEAHFSLHALMVLKRRLLNALGVLPPGERYYTLADARDLLSWPEEAYVAIWAVIETNILEGNVKGLFDTTCPFCYYYSQNCKECAYGKTHGICSGESESGWHRIMDLIKVTSPNNDDYKNMLRVIEEHVKRRKKVKMVKMKGKYDD